MKMDLLKLVWLCDGLARSMFYWWTVILLTHGVSQPRNCRISSRIYEAGVITCLNYFLQKELLCDQTAMSIHTQDTLL